MKETWKNIKKVYSYGKKYKLSIILQAIGSLIGIIIGITFPLLIAQQVFSFTNSLWEQLLYISLIVCGIEIIDYLKNILIRRNTQIFRRGTVKNIQLDLGSEILKIEQQDIDSNSSGTFIQRLTSDTDKMASIFTVGMGYLTGMITSIGAFIAIFLINKTVFLFYLVASIILILVNLIKVKKYGKKDLNYRKQSDVVYGITAELVRGVRDIKMLNAKKGFLKNLEENVDIQNQKNFEMRNVDINYNFIFGTLHSVLELFLIILLIYLTSNNHITIAIGIALFTYRSKVLSDFMDRISNLLVEIKNFDVSCNRVFAILENKEFKKEEFGTKHLDKIKGNFSFEKVSFGYTKDELVLKDLSFKIRENETIGFVGKSGAGKTTIFNLLCKLYKVDSGKITIENENINDLDEESIRSNITIINQNPYIFNLSIKDNLRLIKEDLTDQEMIEACKIACLDDYIETLPEKYDTVVGEGGVVLSGGQKQRLAIARAFVRKTEIILFDEATSALDNETQSKIQQAINNLKNDYTILIIAHRLSTVMSCDKIMVLEDGTIKDSGTHKELLKKSKTYKKLYENELSENNY